MEVRPFAVTAGGVTLVMLGLAGAVLLGESSPAPAPPDAPTRIATARPEPPPLTEPQQPAGDATTAEARPPGDATPASPPHDLAPEPEPAAPPPVVPPPVLPPPHPASRIPHHHAVRVLPPVEPTPPIVEAAPPGAAVPPAPAPAVPVPVRPRPPVVDHRYDGVLTVAEIGRLKRSLRLSPDQAPYWPPIASLLGEVGRRQMAQVDAGRRPTFDLPGDLSSRLYAAAMPLLGTLREDQKEVVRRHAKSLGLESVASFI